MNLLCTPGCPPAAGRRRAGDGALRTQATMSSSRLHSPASSSARSGRLLNQPSSCGWRCRVSSSRALKRATSRRLPISASASSRLSTHASCGTALAPNTRWLNSRISTRQCGIARSSPTQARTFVEALGHLGRGRALEHQPPGKKRLAGDQLASTSPRSHSFCTCARRPAGRVQLIRPPAPSRRGTPRSTGCAASRCGLPRYARSRRWRRRAR
jgi:hypothetical protein